jgi:hypothetical protein
MCENFSLANQSRVPDAARHEVTRRRAGTHLDLRKIDQLEVVASRPGYESGWSMEANFVMLIPADRNPGS